MTSPELEVLDFDLGALAGARRLGNWMFEQFEHHVGLRAVEVGPGIGTFSERLLEGGVEDLLLIEPDLVCSAALERRFAGDDRVRVVRETLPVSPTLAAGSGTFDFVLCQNVLEHIDDDAAATESMAHALRPGGTLGLLVPAHPRLFGSLDASYGHYRRYTKASLANVVRGTDLELIEIHSFNLLGVPGWWLKSRRRATRLDRRSLAVYEFLVRFWRPLEERLRPPWGLSLVAVGRRPLRPEVSAEQSNAQ